MTVGKADAYSASFPYRCQFKNQKLLFQFSSPLVFLRRKQRWLKCMASCTQVRNLENPLCFHVNKLNIIWSQCHVIVDKAATEDTGILYGHQFKFWLLHF